jgi:hypothetical protein
MRIVKMGVFMKNLLFIFTILGFLAGFEQALIATSVTTTIPTITPEVAATATPITITAKTAATVVATFAIGSTLLTTRKYGIANVIASATSIALIGATCYVTAELLKNRIIVGLLSANPLATSLIIGVIVTRLGATKLGNMIIGNMLAIATAGALLNRSQ